MAPILNNLCLEGWRVFAQMAPYLLLGFLVAGVLSVLIPPAWVERHLGGRGPKPVLTASIVGVPLPLCSCGVIPVAASLRRNGASRGATTSFLLSTPQTGVDSIAVTYALLGPAFALFRPIAAFATGLAGGGLVQALDGSSDQDTPSAQPRCCSDGCDDHETSAIRRAITHGFVTLPRDIGWALAIGVVVAALMTVLIPPDYLGAYVGGGVVSILILMAAGVPVYVCATASVPIALGFIHAGASPGAALAFLIAGPATNAATLSTLWKILGRRSALIYLLTVAGSAVLCGLAMDAWDRAGLTALPVLGEHAGHAGHVGVMAHIAGALLLVVLAVAHIRRKPSDKTATDDLVLHIDGMTCGHCASRVHEALAAVEGVQHAEVDLEAKQAVVSGADVRVDALIEAVANAGYRAHA